ncbi:MAG: GNAT family N-acetyltransferase [bacterium]
MIQLITRDEILNGLKQYYYCYMFGANLHEYKCDMWPTIFDEVGGIGFLARDGSKIVGQMIFIPKKHARHIALPTSPQNDNIDKTMVIGCLYVLKEYSGKGIASQMIEKLIDFCRNNGYQRIEACVYPSPPEQVGMNISFFPFRKFGFVLDKSQEGCEYNSESRICHLDLN